MGFSSQIYGQFANVTTPSGGFAIDGGLRANTPTANQGDWYPGGDGSGLSVFSENGVPLPPATGQTSGRASGENFNGNDNVFAEGSKFNDYVSDLKWTTSTALDKGDINNALYHVSRDAGNDQWIFISGDRQSTNGTSYIDFELLQGTVVQNSNGTFTGTPATGKPYGGGRTENDIIISMEYSNGGTKPNVFIYQWKKSVIKGKEIWSYIQVASTSGLLANAFAETNRTGAELNVPYLAFGTNTYQQFAFVEAAVNISYLLSISGQSCSSLNINTLWVKTKASDSSTAALKDYIAPIPVDLKFGSTEITPITAKCADNNTAYLLSATPSGGTFSGLGVSGTGNPATSPYYFTPSSAGVGTHKISYTSADGSCKGSIDIVVNPTPAGTNTSQTLCSLAAGGTNATFDLTTKNTTVVGSSGATVSGWYETYTAGVFSNLIATPAAYVSGSKTVYAKLSGTGSCIGVANNVLTVNATPSAPTVVYNPPACDKATFSITITSVTSGAIYTVKDKNAENIIGILPSNSITANGTGDITFSNIPAGSGYQVSVSVNGCGSGTTTCGTSIATKIATIDTKTTVTAAPIVAKTSTAGFDAYPVPFKDQLTVKYKFDYKSDVKIEVFNAQGISVLSKSDTNGYMNKEVTLDLKLNKEKEQVYIVKLTTDRETSTKKVLSSK